MSRKQLTYLSQSCGTVAVLPAVMHHPSFREEVPPRWYQALGVLLGQPSFGLGLKLGNDTVKQLCLEYAAVYERARQKPPRCSLPFSYTFAVIHHCCGDPPVTSALCNFRTDDTLGSVLVAPITAVRFVKLNNVMST